jgi:hypothetical protein
VTLSWQYVSNTGHRLSDGFFVERGQSVTSAIAADVDYGITDRLAVSGGIPYVFAKYTGALPPMSNLPVDSCRCWHSGFQDVSLGGRYRFGNERWAVTPLVHLGVPSNSYPYRGEAVVGKNLNEMQVGVWTARRLGGPFAAFNLQAGYTYALVEKAVDDISVNRSNGYFDVGFAATRRLYLRTSWIGQHTHGGVQAGSVTGVPFPFPGELNSPDRRAERDRILRVNYMQWAGGASYSAGPVDVFASFTKYAWGRDAHNGHVLGMGATWYFPR